MHCQTSLKFIFSNQVSQPTAYSITKDQMIQVGQELYLSSYILVHYLIKVYFLKKNDLKYVSFGPSAIVFLQ